MKHQHIATLQALYAHPVPHNLQLPSVEALFVDLGAKVKHLPEHRLRVHLSNGNTMVLHAPLDEDAISRIRWFLQLAGVTPEHPFPTPSQVKGEHANRLVIHLDHRGARLWWLRGDNVQAADLRPHGLWRSHQRLSHRHDRDVAGQRAPLDYEYLRALSEAIDQADRVLLLGHGHGQSDLRELLKHYIGVHHPALLDRVETISVDDTACTDAELLAIAHKHFGNQRHCRASGAQGQESYEATTW